MKGPLEQIIREYQILRGTSPFVCPARGGPCPQFRWPREATIFRVALLRAGAKPLLLEIGFSSARGGLGAYMIPACLPNRTQDDCFDALVEFCERTWQLKTHSRNILRP